MPSKENRQVKFSGPLLNIQRIQGNFTIGEVAQRVGVSRMTVSKWEKEVTEPQARHVRKLDKIFGFKTGSSVLNDEILTIKELAKLLKVSVVGIRKKLHRCPESIPHFRIGRILRFNRTKVLDHLQNSNDKT